MGDGGAPPADGDAMPRPVIFGQLGGCNLTSIIRFVPGGEVVPHAVRASTASLVSAPIDPSLYQVAGCPKKAAFIRSDFAKKPYKNFSECEWDVLLLDLLRDYFTGTAVFEGGQVTEINEWVHGDELSLDDVLKVPYRLIRWHDPDFFDLWSASFRTLHERLLKPRMDAGRHVAVAVLRSIHSEYRDNGEAYVQLPDGGTHESSEVLARMYAFVAALDPRIIMLDVEDEFRVGAYDTENGPFAYHMVADYHARAAELLCARIGLPGDVVSRHISARRMVETHRRYSTQMEREAALKRELEDTRRANSAELEFAAGRMAALESDLAAVRATLHDTLARQAGQDELIAGLTSRLSTALERNVTLQTQYAAREASLTRDLADRVEAFDQLARARDELMTHFREHIVQYDSLREELNRRDALEDENYELVLALTQRIRSFAERWSANAAHGNLADAMDALHDLTARLDTAKGAVRQLVDATDALEAPLSDQHFQHHPRPA